MKSGPIILSFGILIIGVSAGAITTRILDARHTRDAAAAAATSQVTPEKPAGDEEGTVELGGIDLTAAQVKALDIQTTVAESKTLSPSIRVFGTLEEDPSHTFILRATASGTITSSTAWPTLGQQITDGTTIGTLEPRLAPADTLALDAQRVALQTQATSAQSEITAATSSLAAAKTAFDRLKSLNATKDVSDRAVEEADAKVQAESARLDAAKKSLDLANAALHATTGKLAPTPLVIDHAGEVAEVLVQPGEAVEPGQPILRIARFDSILIHADLPADSTLSEVPESALVYLLGNENKPFAALAVGTAPLADPKTHGQIILYRATLVDSTLRPGMPVTVQLPTSGEPLKGTFIPRQAVVRYNGKAFVYAEADDESDVLHTHYDRLEVNLDHPVKDGWIDTTTKIEHGTGLVTTGANALLSAEVSPAPKAGAD